MAMDSRKLNFLYIHILPGIHQIKNLDIHKLSINFLVISKSIAYLFIR
jgi:hypothetical protein